MKKNDDTLWDEKMAEHARHMAHRQEGILEKGYALNAELIEDLQFIAGFDSDNKIRTISYLWETHLSVLLVIIEGYMQVSVAHMMLTQGEKGAKNALNIWCAELQRILEDDTIKSILASTSIQEVLAYRKLKVKDRVDFVKKTAAIYDRIYAEDKDKT